jgi:hypothetical protein
LPMVLSEFSRLPGAEGGVETAIAVNEKKWIYQLSQSKGRAQNIRTIWVLGTFRTLQFVLQSHCWLLTRPWACQSF